MCIMPLNTVQRLFEMAGLCVCAGLECVKDLPAPLALASLP